MSSCILGFQVTRPTVTRIQTSPHDKLEFKIFSSPDSPFPAFKSHSLLSKVLYNIPNSKSQLHPFPYIHLFLGPCNLFFFSKDNDFIYCHSMTMVIYISGIFIKTVLPVCERSNPFQATL